MSDPVLPRLLVSREEAREKIQVQRTKGDYILSSITPTQRQDELQTKIKKAESDSRKWASFTIDLLKTLFEGLQIGREFGDARVTMTGYEYPIREFREWMNLRLERLDSILERLDLFPLEGVTVESKAAPHEESNCNKNEIFIVHGHDEGLKHEVARLIDKLGLTPIILHEQLDKGRTIIEKFEDHSDTCGFAVVLMTPDDIGCHKDQCSNQKPRARQNVIFELGYFVGKLGRQRVCALQKGDVELPTDYLGVLYKEVDTAGAWKSILAKEISESGISLDLSKAVY
jgi:predicted nucleotide-binding protein